jgi:hypothetical protein
MLFSFPLTLFLTPFNSTRHLTLAPPEHDTSTVLLAQARSSLDGKVGRAIDSTWVKLAHNGALASILGGYVAAKVAKRGAVSTERCRRSSALAQASTRW